ncbi:phosphoglycerol transferase MdoB-like AlkP superfamily enzyme [Paenibacillus endophyticus]|uniref:Phosphoglycerol transferase MdoB-like AlkP superfamily enzyme n=1 Tax=Paenibacillus endophyticus TaxID=1294268 RepID=A0A7W5G9E4_9BACL|nr:LTA synthase family protein [Paenibacillus endophyticus]MBB3151238.1 phosphoglycerol transferase MdoB-like AlkP superfamily enzyme [Paenibacillus endophyticus]
MLSNHQKPLRRSMSMMLVWLERYKAIDLLLFTAALLAKVYLFSDILHVKNMKMTSTDAIIELGAIMLFSFWTVWLPARGRILSLIGLNMLASFVLYADIIYYRYFQDLISIPVLLQFSQVDSLGESIGTLLHVKDFLLFLDWIVIVPFAIYMLMRGKRDLRLANEYRRISPVWQKALVRIVMSAAIFGIGASLVFTNVNEAKRTWGQGIFEGNWWNLSIYNVTGALGFHGYDAYRYVKRNWLDAETVSAEQASETKSWIEARGALRGALEQDKLFGAYTGSNVLMIQLEAFQNFMINKSIGGQEITPHLNGLIKQSAYFSQFYHQTAQGRTSDADFTANCSMQPVPNGSVFIQYAPNEFDCMSSTLKTSGYGTSVFHAYEGGFWNRNTMYHNMQYDQFYSLKHFTLDEKIGWALGDKSFFRQSMDVISDQKQPFYSFLITLSSHYPFTMPKAEQQLSLGELDGTIMGDYLQSIHYVDAALGELIERMKAEGLWDNTILAMYGDHDNSIKDWSLLETFLGKPLNEMERQMMLKQVPLLVHLPGDEHAGTYSGVGGQLDVTPTIMHLLGMSTADQYLIGTPLLTELPLQGKLVVQRNGSFTDGSVYYLPSSDGIMDNGACWSIPSQALTDMNACAAAAENARTELTVSDQIVMNNLIEHFKEQSATEARAGSQLETAAK